MKKFLSISASVIVLAVAGFFIFYEAPPPPEPLIMAPSDPEATRRLQAAVDEDYCARTEPADTIRLPRS